MRIDGTKLSAANWLRQLLHALEPKEHLANGHGYARGFASEVREPLIACTTSEFRLSRLDAETTEGRSDVPDGSENDEMEVDASKGLNAVALEVQGTKSITKLAASIAEIPGVVSVKAGDSVTSPD